jgi:hypothetical protein
MPQDRFLTPAGSDSPGIPLPLETTETETYRQQQEAARLGTVGGGSPVTEPVSLQPGERLLTVYWRGSRAQRVADAFRDDILNDPGVPNADLETQGAASQPADGTYALAASRTEVKRVDAGFDNLWRADIVLSDDPA